MVALGSLKFATVCKGVKSLPEQKTDAFFLMLNKSDKEFSPTKMRNDYSINEWMLPGRARATWRKSL